MGIVTGVGVGALWGLVLQGRNLPLPLEATLLYGATVAAMLRRAG